MAGEYLYQFFADRHSLSEPNAKGEISVLCPFEHHNGFERNPSAHINPEKATFHCKVCEAEGRFSNGGLSEIGFVSKYHGLPYRQSLKFIDQMEPSASADDKETWAVAVNNLLGHGEYMAYLSSRGITKEAVQEYEIGHKGFGITYPIWVNGMLLDERTYNPEPTPDNPAKIKSKSGAGAFLFPFDHWKQDSRPTVLVAGENDALLARIHGFNAVTGTAGEGRFPEMFLSYFKGKTVYVCYDADAAGQHGGKNAAFLVKQSGAEVFMVDLGLTGEKHDKDITDFFVKRGFTAADFQRCLDEAKPFSQEDEIEIKNKRFPLVDLWRVVEGDYHGKHVTSRVVLSGIYDQNLKVPAAVEWQCLQYNTENKVCDMCRHQRESGIWTIDDNLRDVLKLVEIDDKKQRDELKAIIGIPQKCPGCSIRPKAVEPVYKVVFTPDVDSSNEGANVKLGEQYAYTLGLNDELTDGNKYRAYFRTYAHPKDQRTFLVVDKVEDSDNSVNSFQLTPEIDRQLQQFKMSPTERAEQWEKRLHALTVFFKPYKLISDSYLASFHSVLEFKMFGHKMKGYPEIYIAGDTRTGKTETGKNFQNYIKLGNTTEVKNASIAGLIGGADHLPTGGWRVNWGSIPKNHRGMLILDEAGGLGQKGIISAMTAMRSEGYARLEKIAKGVAPARTRLVWIANPIGQDGNPRPVTEYANGVNIMRELIGAPEDIARFDACVIIEDDGRESRPNEKPEAEMWDALACRNLVCWAWSRTADQVKFAFGVEDYVVDCAADLNAKFDCSVKFLGKEAFKKIARIAVSAAAACYSNTDGGESVLVEKEHVDWACDYLRRCYSDNAFRLDEFSRRERDLKSTNKAIDDYVAGIIRRSEMFVKVLMDATEHVSMLNLQMMSGMERDKFSELISKMGAASLIQFDARKGVLASQRFRAAVRNCRKIEKEIDMVPLTEQTDIM